MTLKMKVYVATVAPETACITTSKDAMEIMLVRMGITPEESDCTEHELVLEEGESLL